MLSTILSVFVPFLLSLFLTPLMMVIAKKKNIVDIPNARKSHSKPIPLLGGVAILIAVTISIASFAVTTTPLVKITLLGAIFGVSLIGLIDDIIALSAKRRLVVLIIQALIVYIGCIQFYTIAHINTTYMEIIFGAFVVLWIVAVTNAVNFSDGLDGLSSYLSIVASISFAILFALQGRIIFALPIALSICGAVAGFLTYNRNPAMIFMGDAGSMLLGFMLGLLSIVSTAKEDTILSLVVPIFILFVPIADMLTSILRRIIIRRPVMKPDKMHFHHVLNQKIDNHLFVAIILSLIQIVFAALGILVFIFKIYVLGVIVLGAIFIILCIFTTITSLGIRNKKDQEKVSVPAS